MAVGAARLAGVLWAILDSSCLISSLMRLYFWASCILSVVSRRVKLLSQLRLRSCLASAMMRR